MTEVSHKLSRLQRAMVKTMSGAVHTAALSQVTREIDMSSVVADRAEVETKPSINTYVLAAVSRCLGSHPMLNGRLEDRSVVVPDHVNLGLAVSVDEGLVVPVIHGADTMSFEVLGAAAERMADKARSGALTFEDIEGGTFTVSNLGMFGVDGGFAIPPPPQGAILLVGRITERFVPDEAGSPLLKPFCWFGLTFDHRFIDGATAARLLTDIDGSLGDATALRNTKGEPR